VFQSHITPKLRTRDEGGIWWPASLMYTSAAECHIYITTKQRLHNVE